MMPAILRRCAVLAMLGALPAEALAQRPAVVADGAGSGAAERAREAATRLRTEHALPGLAVAVWAGGKVVWEEGMGDADREAGIPAEATTRFALASVSKPLTAVAALLLHERGVLDLDAPVGRYVPAFPHPVTVRQLAGHLAWIRHYEMRDFLEGSTPTNVTEALTVFREDSLLSAPGSRFHYSSYGYVLLSAAMEGATGKAFPEHMRERLFEPLAMARTGVDDPEEPAPRRARQYLATDEGHYLAPYEDRTGQWAAAGFVSTAGDLARFGGALLSPGFLRAESLALLFTPMRTAAGEETGYAFGWRVGRDAEGRRIVHHGGLTPSARAFLLLYPDHGVAVAVLANVRSGFAEEDVARIAAPFLPVRSAPPPVEGPRAGGGR